MKTLDDFIINLNNKIPNNLDELSKSRYVYIELGKIVSFDPNYIFGNSKTKSRIYKNITYDKNTLNEIFATKMIICKSLSYIYEYILNVLDIQICTVNPIDDIHVFNIITTKDKKRYIADLQLDLENIQSRSKTKFFASDRDCGSTILSEEYLTEIDKSIGYIDEYYNYTDDDIEFLRSSISNVIRLDSKMELILDYIYSNRRTKHMKFIEVSHYYNHILDKLLNKDSKKNLFHAYCYNKDKEIKQYISLISVDVGKQNTKIYILYEHEYKYIPITQEEIILLLKSGFIIRYGTLLLMQKHYTSTSSFHKL